MIIGIDQSKRSTAAVCIDMDKVLVDFMLVNPPKSMDGEELIHYQWQDLDEFILPYATQLRGVALEGLSFNSVGSGKDLLAGIFWYIRTCLFRYYPTKPVGVIPVLAWRSKVIDAAERKVINSFRVKDGIKKFTVEKLPYEVKVKFEQYIREQGIKKEAIYDLADAYFIAQYRLSLEGDSCLKITTKSKKK